MVSNGLRYQWVLTFAEPRLDVEGRVGAMRLCGKFTERLREHFGAMPYLYSPELHPGGHGWHINLYLPRRLPHDEVERLWGHGHVWVSDYLKHSLVKVAKLSRVEAVRLAASYACKYASKDWSELMLAGGAHRYEIAQGCKPEKLTIPRLTLAGALQSAEDVFHGTKADHMWSSSESPTWNGPPAHCLRWARSADDYDDG
jgi:hypothetical protein